MSRFASARVAPLLAALVLAGCGLDFSTPRAYRCSTDEECRGGWRCLGDAYCHDPDVGVATPCGADGDCAGGWRCLGDKVCHDPAVGVTTPCQATADCAGAWRCADGQCRDPEVGVTVTCLTSADCLGGWYCGREKVCRDPSKPGPFDCLGDGECAGGWRCSTEGRCVDAAAELALAPATGPVPPALHLSPRTVPPLALRLAAPAASHDAAGVAFTRAQALTALEAGAVTALSLWSETRVGATSTDHRLLARRWPVSSAQVVDFLASDREAFVLFVDGGVQRGLADGGLAPVPLPAPVRRLASSTHPTPRGWETDLVGLLDPASGGAAVLLVDGGTWGSQVVDVAPVELEDGGGAAQAWAEVAPAGTGVVQQRLFIAEDPALPGKAAWSRDTPADEARLSELRTLGSAVAAAWRAGTVVGSGFQFVASDYAELIHPATYAKQAARVTCPEGEHLVDFELVKDATAGIALEAACLAEGAESALVYVATSATDQRLVFERRGLRHAGTGQAHARMNRWGAPRLSSALRDFELSPVPTARPAVVGLVARAPVVVSEGQLYLPASGGGLELQRADADPLDRVVGVVEGGASVILGTGAAFDFSDADAGPRLDFVLEGTPRLSRATARRFGGALVASGDDTLYAAQRPDAGATLLRSVLRPAPGFPIDAWAARATDGGYEGWLVANNQLFRLEANSVARWRSTPWPVQGRDVLGTWWAGDGARVGTATGEVLSLPSRVPVVPPVPGGVTSIAGWCGDVLATADDEILSWRGDAGWVVVDAGVPGPLRAPRLVPAGEGVFVTDEDGALVLFGLGSGCP